MSVPVRTVGAPSEAIAGGFTVRIRGAEKRGSFGGTFRVLCSSTSPGERSQYQLELKKSAGSEQYEISNEKIHLFLLTLLNRTGAVLYVLR